jgi:hypothetical protein
MSPRMSPLRLCNRGLVARAANASPGSRIGAALTGAALWACAPAALAASAAVSQAAALGDSDPFTALVILEKAHNDGDVEASAALARTLFFAAPPRQNRERACDIARKLAEANDRQGWSLTASCLLAGTVKSPAPLDAARAAARRAVAQGLASGGTALFTAYAADPQFSTLGADGKPDPARRAALAAVPAAQRSVQAEAWTGLSFALEAGDPMATAFGIATLAETSAPGNLALLVGLAGRSPVTAARFGPMVDAARYFQRLGGTHASVRVADSARPAALAAARAAAARDLLPPCNTIELVRTEPGDLAPDASFLPVALGPLKSAYLVSGQWLERWAHDHCGTTVTVQMSFVADGWGGARFEAEPAPRSVVRKSP